MSPFVPDARGGPWWLRLTSWVDGAYRVFGAVRAEVALARLSPGALAGLAVERFGSQASAYDRPLPGDRQLFEWERAAIDDFFPRPPARLLVGGVGAGREVLALAALGYRVTGFEPSALLCETLGRRARATGLTTLEVIPGSYEEVVTAVRGRDGRGPVPDGARRILGAAPYDGVIVGWGSIGCVVSAEAREALLPALSTLCPSGPVLASFELHVPDRGGAARAAALARRLLAWLPGSRPVAPGDHLEWFGFQHGFTDGEVEGLAARAGYEMVRRAHEPNFHVVLVPQASEARATARPTGQAAHVA